MTDDLIKILTLRSSFKAKDLKKEGLRLKTLWRKSNLLSLELFKGCSKALIGMGGDRRYDFKQISNTIKTLP